MRVVRPGGDGRGGVGESVLSRIAARVGTPVYVYDVAAIQARYRELDRALAGFPHHIHYSVKANSTLGVLATLQALGAGADIVSGGELQRVLRAGFAARDVIFSGVGKTRPEIEAALAAGVGLINLESAGELDLVAAVARDMGTAATVGIRVNPDVTADTHPYTQTGERGMKFGIPLDQVVAVASRVRAEPALTLRCVGMHIGSQIADSAPYGQGAAKLERLIEELRAAGITTLECVDVGGGLGISYAGEPAMVPEVFAGAVAPLARATGLTLLTEPGRFLVGSAGRLLTRVLYRKHTGGRDIVVVDAGMNDLLRPALYGAHHEIRVVTATPGGSEAPVDVVGPLCESGDFLGLKRVLPGAGPGALLAVEGAGAYAFSMSSHYNSRPRAAEILLDGDRFALARARETVDDLMRGETAAAAWEPA